MTNHLLLFRRKIMKAMNIKEAKLLEGKIDVAEFFAGGPEIGKSNRSKGNKKRIMMGIQMKKKEL